MPARCHPSFLLVAGNAVAATFMFALGAAARPDDRLVYVVYPPWSDADADVRSIVEAGGLPIARTSWPTAFKVAFGDGGGLARLASGGPVLTFAAGRRPFCSSPDRP